MQCDFINPIPPIPPDINLPLGPSPRNINTSSQRMVIFPDPT